MEEVSNQQIIELQHHLRKADQFQALDILQQLEQFNISVQQLKDTKIGKTVKRVMKNYPDLRIQVTQLIDKWRQLVKRQNKPPQNTQPRPQESSRQKIVQLFEGIFNDTSKSIELENAIFTLIPEKSYGQKVRQLSFNLKKNQALKQKVLTGEIPLNQFLTMTPRELAPTEMQQQREDQEKQLIESKRSDWNLVNNTMKDGLIQCSRCRGKKTMTEQKQTRSADEPMTTQLLHRFVRCLDCDHSWKF